MKEIHKIQEELHKEAEEAEKNYGLTLRKVSHVK